MSEKISRHHLQILSRYDAVYMDTNVLLMDYAERLMSSLQPWFEQGGRIRLRTNVVVELKRLAAKKKEISKRAAKGLQLLDEYEDAFLVEEPENPRQLADKDFYMLFISECERRSQLLITEDQKLGQLICDIDAYVKSPLVVHSTNSARINGGIICERKEPALSTGEMLSRVLYERALYMDASVLQQPHVFLFLKGLLPVLKYMRTKVVHVFGESWQQLSAELQAALSLSLTSYLKVHPAQPERSERIALCQELPRAKKEPALITADESLARCLSKIWPQAVDALMSPLQLLKLSEEGGLSRWDNKEIPILLKKKTAVEPVDTAAQATATVAEIPPRPLERALLENDDEKLLRRLKSAPACEVAKAVELALSQMKPIRLKPFVECDQLRFHPRQAAIIIGAWLSAYRRARGALHHPDCFKYYCLAIDNAMTLSHTGRLAQELLDSTAKAYKKKDRFHLWQAYKYLTEHGAPNPTHVTGQPDLTPAALRKKHDLP